MHACLQLVDATEVATQLEARGQLPWMASATDLPYSAAGDSVKYKHILGFSVQHCRVPEALQSLRLFTLL